MKNSVKNQGWRSLEDKPSSTKTSNNSAHISANAAHDTVNKDGNRPTIINSLTDFEMEFIATQPTKALLKAFWGKVDRRGHADCWPWTASKKNGYGKLKIASGCTAYAHRVSYAIHKGVNPVGQMVCHSCDNPECVNPAHLFLGDAAANNQDKARKGRCRTPDQRGESNAASKLCADDVIIIKRRISAGESNTAIAADFPVSHSTISLIRRGKSWATLSV